MKSMGCLKFLTLSRGDRASRYTAVSTAVVLATCAVITAGGQIIAANWNAFFGAREHYNVDPTLPDDARVRQTQVTSGEVEWIRYRANVTYLASTDGIVSAFSGGDGAVTGGVVFEGASQASLEVRTRFGRYDGAVLPVREGRYWLVQAEGGGGRNVEVQWLGLPRDEVQGE